MDSVRKVFAYFWDFKAKKILKLESDMIHPYAKVQNKVDADRMVGKKWVFPFVKKNK